MGPSLTVARRHIVAILLSLQSKKARQALMSALWTQNMHPPRLYAEEIAESVMKLYSSERDQSIELFFDDKDYFYTIHI